MKYQKIYDKSPIFFQNFMATVYGYVTKRDRYGKTYYEHLKYLEEVHKYSREELEELQFQELMKLLRNTVQNSKFYRELYEGIDISSFQSVNDLKKLPIVTKEMIRENLYNVLTISKEQGVEANTGGTTGKSLTVYFTREDMQKRMATLDFFKIKNGFKNMEMKKATFMGKHIVPPKQKIKVFWRYNAAIRQMVYSSFHITEENMPSYIRSLNKFKPQAIDGYPSSMYDIASYMLRNNIKFDFKPLAIFPTAETLTLEHREVIENAFCAKVRNQYASSEGAPFVWECECGNYHYDITTGIIENISDSNEILVTSFTSYGTPLIRYRIGDNIIFEDFRKICNCDFNTPLVKSIEGRASDFLYSTSGARVNHVGSVFKNSSNVIIKAQLVQNSLNHVLIKVVVDNELKDEHKKKSVDEIRRRLGNDMRVDFEIVDDIPRERSGKYKLIVNKVKL